MNGNARRSGPPSLADLQLREADWAYQELLDCVRLIQRYRATYVAAMFATIGWLLTQAIQAHTGNATVPSTTAGPVANVGAAITSNSVTLESLRSRPDIALVLCLVPLLNSYFFVLLAEVQARLLSLAKYRYALGFALGQGIPVWRWELWKGGPGSFQSSTAPSNILNSFVALAVPVGALWFAEPAIRDSQGHFLSACWVVSGGVLGVVLLWFIYMGFKNLPHNNVTDVDPRTWFDLWEKRKASNHPGPGAKQG